MTLPLHFPNLILVRLLPGKAWLGNALVNQNARLAPGDGGLRRSALRVRNPRIRAARGKKLEFTQRFVAKKPGAA